MEQCLFHFNGLKCVISAVAYLFSFAYSIEVVEKARSRARIKISNYLMVMTILACLGYAYSGRKAADRGESVVKMNMDWHKEYQAQVAQERAAAAVQKTA